jgi:HD-GYP domain-containing protein (c-di-GMP phosphodiesterase class II)
MIKKLTIDELKPGMEIVRLSSDVWEHLPGLYTEPGAIRSEDQVRRIRQNGFTHAFIEARVPGDPPLEKRLDAALAKHHDAPSPKLRVPFEQEIDAAHDAYEKAQAQAKIIMDDTKMGRQVDYKSSVEVVDEIVNSAIRNPDTLLCLAKLAKYDDYTYSHSINVSAISVVFGEYLGLDHNELNKLGVAGMMHDLGKTAVPERIINKRARLSEKEFEEIKRHPEYSYDLLRKQESVPDQVLQAVRDHHEKFNGSGYPRKIQREKTSPLARIISLADVYDALTSDRSYKDAILPNKALAVMYGMRGQDFDPKEVQSFIKCLGIFPAGSLVKLSTNFYALVYESNPTQPLLPKVKIILDPDLRPIRSVTVDLAAHQAESDKPLEILECTDPSAYRINLKPFLTRRS